MCVEPSQKPSSTPATRQPHKQPRFRRRRAPARPRAPCASAPESEMLPSALAPQAIRRTPTPSTRPPEPLIARAPLCQRLSASSQRGKRKKRRITKYVSHLRARETAYPPPAQILAAVYIDLCVAEMKRLGSAGGQRRRWWLSGGQAERQRRGTRPGRRRTRRGAWRGAGRGRGLPGRGRRRRPERRRRRRRSVRLKQDLRGRRRCWDESREVACARAGCAAVGDAQAVRRPPPAGSVRERRRRGEEKCGGGGEAKREERASMLSLA